LKTIPNEPGLSAPALVAKSLDQELNAGSIASIIKSESLPVNDLTSIVKKKKKPINDASVTEDAHANGSTSTKRKAEDGDASSPVDKKVKLEDVSSTAS
jgi:HAT1-interacting factor 1